MEPAVEIKSAGYEAGSFASIQVQGRSVHSSIGRGLNFVALDSIMQVQSTACFDTCTEDTEVTKMVDYINELVPGTIVLIACMDSAIGGTWCPQATVTMDRVGYDALRTVGWSGAAFQFRQAFAFVGVKGGQGRERLDGGSRSADKAITLRVTSGELTEMKQQHRSLTSSSLGAGYVAPSRGDVTASSSLPTLPEMGRRDGSQDYQRQVSDPARSESLKVHSPTLDVPRPGRDRMGSGDTAGPRRGPSIAALDGDASGSKSLPFSHRASLRENKGPAADIGKRYQIDAKEFASGGNGKVFIGRDRQFGDRHVAIKKVACTDPAKTETIRREMEIMKELDHPNICKLFETYEEGRFMYFVMELCEGGELFDQIADAGNVTENAAASIINQVASALCYAHGKNIAHRDLKPENICLVSRDPADNAIKVIDWGLGFFFGGAMRMKSAVGSLAYAAPEVLEAEEDAPYTSSCDQWSLGAMAYVMLSGRPPFWGSFANQLKKMKQESYPMKDPPWTTISSEAKDFIKCLLKADPRARLPMNECMEHPWLKNFRAVSTVSNEAISGVLWNMEKSSVNSKFLSVCLASAARQLDCKNFVEIKEVFQKLDTNHDGTLDMEELRNGFLRYYGMEADQAQKVAEMFAQLDLDENGKIDYTEFCAAALSEKMLEQENMLWMSFKAFDVHGDDGRITKEEIKEVLSKTTVREAWTPEVCDKVASEVMTSFDLENKGYLDFDAWLRMMRSVAWEDQIKLGSADGPDKTGPPSGISAVTRKPTIAWVSLDPRSGAIFAYPLEIARHIEAHHRMNKDCINLGAAFFGARIAFSGSKTGHPFQRTPNGLRDVRRIETQPGNDELEMGLCGSPGEYRFADGAASTTQQRTSGVPANAIDIQEAIELVHAYEEKEAKAAEESWSLTRLSVQFNDATALASRLLWGGGDREAESSRPLTNDTPQRDKSRTKVTI